MDNQKKMRFSVVDTGRDFTLNYEETQTSSKSAVINYGADNRLPQHLNELVRNSATLKAIVDATVAYICGNGINISDDASKWKTKVNRRGETMENIIEQASYDLLVYGGFAINVVFSHIHTVAEIYALDFSRCRSNYNNTLIFYAPKWGQWTGKYETFDAFNLEKIDPEHPSQIYYYKGSSRRVYPYPTWEGAVRDAQTEVESTKLQLNEMANGLVAKHIITLPNDTGALTEKEKDDVEEAIKTKFSGSEATSSFFVAWKEEGMSEVKVDSLHTEDDSNKFVTIKKSARENLFIAFRCNPILVGLNTERSNFNRQEFAEAFELYQRTVVSGYQRKLEKAVNTIISVPGGIQIIPFTLERAEEE